MSRLVHRYLTFQITLRWDVPPLRQKHLCCRRAFATHKDHSPSSLLSQQFERQQNATRGTENVGPFQLGVVQPSTQNVKKWSELSTGGKVLRTTARTTNFSVILLGAGLSAVLVYALASELFSKNSPTVLYGNACDRIKESPLVSKHLRIPLTFHNNPPSTLRPRHRNRHVNSQPYIDPSGREHLLLSFYVRGSDPSNFPAADSDPQSYANRIYEWTTSNMISFSNLTFDDALKWAKETGSDILRASRRAFAYLIGEPLPPMPQPPPLPRQESDRNRSSSEESLWSLSGIFTRLTGKRRTVVRTDRGYGPQWSTGEAHADFVKDANGAFVCRFLLVDLPDSNRRNPLRLFVERTEDVRDDEVMVRWR